MPPEHRGYPPIDHGSEEEEKTKDVALEDLLWSRRMGTPSDLTWVTQPWRCPEPPWTTNKSPSQLKEAVLTSPGLRQDLAQVSRDTGRSEKDLEKEARAILRVLGHKFKMPVVRIWGFLLCKVLKRLYDRILVDPEGVEEFQRVSQELPVVLLPNHRSYLDFLLLSFVNYHFGAPLPAAASGDNLLGMSAASAALRHAGGFFIRRRFGDDLVYRAVVREYLHQVLLDGRHPIEVFVEGARSRTGKSLPPKTGFIQACLDLYRTERVPDIMFIPISITYDRVLEETLYAREMLGVPKPKETLTGLLGARKILKENFGNIHVRFGKPISASESIASESLSVRQIMTQVVKQQQRCAVSTHFPLVCLTLAAYHNDGGLRVTDLYATLNWLVPLVQRTGVRLVSQLSRLWVLKQVDLHRNFLALHEDTITIEGDGGEGNDHSPSVVPAKFVPKALSRLLLQQYANEAMQWIESFCKVALCAFMSDDVERQMKDYKRLNRLLQTEFVYEDWGEEENFRKTRDVLSTLGVLESPRKMTFLVSCLEPYLSGLAAVATFVALQGTTTNDKIAPACQEHLHGMIARGELHGDCVLSLDFTKNSLRTLVELGAGQQETSRSTTRFLWSIERLHGVAKDISAFTRGSYCVNNKADGETTKVVRF